jgi:regulator of nonsense transcripts 2
MFSCSLAEALDMQPPVMPDDGHTTRVTTGTELSPSGKDFSVVEPIWDDEDTKAFYESLPDLRFFLVSFYSYVQFAEM